MKRPQALVLASASPQRARLLRQLGLEFVIAPADVDETPRPDESPEALAGRLACDKARALSTAYPSARILGSDTVVAGTGQIFGKPRNLADAKHMWSVLGGTTHHVFTGVALYWQGSVHSRTVRSEISLDAPNEDEVAAYWATGEPAGAAGAYAIQGQGAQFISHLSGSYSAVMGLPVYETAALLRGSGLELVP